MSTRGQVAGQQILRLVQRDHLFQRRRPAPVSGSRMRWSRSSTTSQRRSPTRTSPRSRSRHRGRGRDQRQRLRHRRCRRPRRRSAAGRAARAVAPARRPGGRSRPAVRARRSSAPDHAPARARSRRPAGCRRAGSRSRAARTGVELGDHAPASASRSRSKEQIGKSTGRTSRISPASIGRRAVDRHQLDHEFRAVSATERRISAICSSSDRGAVVGVGQEPAAERTARQRPARRMRSARGSPASATAAATGSPARRRRIAAARSVVHRLICMHDASSTIQRHKLAKADPHGLSPVRAPARSASCPAGCWFPAGSARQAPAPRPSGNRCG